MAAVPIPERNAKWDSDAATQYWGQVRMLGKSFQVAQSIDKIANFKVKGLPGLGLINAGIEISNLRDAASQRKIHASDIGGTTFNIAIGFLAFSNPIIATGMAIYIIADYSGVLDPAKAYMSQTVDNAVDSQFQNLLK